jgi:hypothetical protein
MDLYTNFHSWMFPTCNNPKVALQIKLHLIHSGDTNWKKGWFTGTQNYKDGSTTWATPSALLFIIQIGSFGQGLASDSDPPNL